MAVREFARHRLRRALYVGVPRAEVEAAMARRTAMVAGDDERAAAPTVAPLEDFLLHQSHVAPRHA